MWPEQAWTLWQRRMRSMAHRRKLWKGEDMEKKDLGLTNMNGMTNEEGKTCGLNDMNCLGEEEKKSGLNDMNGMTEEDGKACSLNDMNCLNERKDG